MYRNSFGRSLLAGLVATTAVLAPGAGPAAGEVRDDAIVLGLPDEIGGYATTHVIVRARPGVVPVVGADGRPSLAPHADRRGARPAGATREATDALQALVAARAVTRIDPVFGTPADPKRAAALGLDRYYRIEVPAGTDTRAFARELAALGALVEHAETDGIGGVADVVPPDVEFGVQYGLLNTGQEVNFSPGTPGADINATLAWDVTTGSEDVIIAVLDAGTADHVDLAGKLLAGYNSVDGTSDTSDSCVSHGTHVAGIAAANTGDATGIAGVSWGARVLPVRILNGCFGDESTLAAGLTWITDQVLAGTLPGVAGATDPRVVVNMSLQFYQGTAALEAAVQYAHASGLTLVAASGNNFIEVAYPAKWPETIAVAATNNEDGVAGFSNAGPELDVAAPGDDVWSLLETSTYGFKDGTSMATPHVSGTAALMLSIDPSLTPDEIKAILIATAVDVEAAGFDEDTGHGRIDALAALLEVEASLADLDDNGLVDIIDLLLLLSDWGPCPAEGACPADLDRSGTVGVEDLLLVLVSWTPSAAD